MATQSVNYAKAGINFSFYFDVEIGKFTVKSSSQLWERGDWEFNQKDFKVEEAPFKFDAAAGTVKFTNGVAVCYIKHGGKDVNGVKIEDAAVISTLKDWIDQLEAKRNELVAARAAEAKLRQDARPAPAFNADDVIIFSYGCDTGLLHCSEGEDIVKAALAQGAEKGTLLRGERDGSNQYPGQMDEHIPASYATCDEDGKWSAVGYTYVYEQCYYISRKDFDAAKEVVEAPKREREAARAAKFIEAKATGKPVMLSSYVAPEHDTPLRNDGEGDMVTCCEMAMPDGTVKMEYHHNY